MEKCKIKKIKGAFLNANIKKRIAIKFAGDAAIELIPIRPEFKGLQDMQLNVEIIS